MTLEVFIHIQYQVLNEVLQTSFNKRVRLLMQFGPYHEIST